MRLSDEVNQGWCEENSKVVIGHCPFTEDPECPGTCKFYQHRKVTRDAEKEAHEFLRETAGMGDYN